MGQDKSNWSIFTMKGESRENRGYRALGTQFREAFRTIRPAFTLFEGTFRETFQTIAARETLDVIFLAQGVDQASSNRQLTDAADHAHLQMVMMVAIWVAVDLVEIVRVERRLAFLK